MRSALFSFIILAACSQDANHLGNPLLLPVNALTNATENAIYNRRRASVELIVKSGFDEIIPDIRAGGGFTLTEAMQTAQIPIDDVRSRILQMQGDIGIYENNPEALITALMVYGS